MNRNARLSRTLPAALGALLLGGGALLAQAVGYTAPPCPFPGSPSYPGLPGVCHPYPQPHPQTSVQSHFCGETPVASCADCTGAVCRTHVDTGAGVLPAWVRVDGAVHAANPFNHVTFPGTNLLPTVYTNMFDSGGVEMLDTLPSTPDVPYALHGDPVVHEINPTSPEDDLAEIFRRIRDDVTEIDKLANAEGRSRSTVLDEIAHLESTIRSEIGLGLRILEGEPLADSRLATRAYDGLPLLHYDSPEKIKRVEPVYDAEGNLVGGNVDVHQIWFGQHIESDTAYVDPSAVLEVPWTVTYRVDTLNRGHDDFSPFVTYTDTPWYDRQTGKPCAISGNTARGRIARSEACARLPAYFDSTTGKPCQEGTPNCALKAAPPPHIGMDQTFFNMEEGTRTIFKVRMTPGDYLNLVYTWGWRMHPPRIQVMEKALKKVPGQAVPGAPGKPRPDGVCPSTYGGCMLPQIEQSVFCNPDGAAPKINSGDMVTGTSAPCREDDTDCRESTCGIPDLPACTSVRDSEADKLYAIGRIGDLSPAKRMWQALRAARDAAAGDAPADPAAIAAKYAGVAAIVETRAEPAFYAYLDRTELPCFERDPDRPRPGNCLDGLNPDPDSDINLLYVNNTTYGELTAGGWVRWPVWKTRFASWKKERDAGETDEPPPVLRVAAFNGDHFPHGYVIADFGGNRGWENQFKSSVKVAGSGCWFTFGRAHWWLNTGGPNGLLCVPPAGEPSAYEPFGELGQRKIEVQFNFEPSRRLRFYQFDPFHHDVAIYSVH